MIPELAYVACVTENQEVFLVIVIFAVNIRKDKIHQSRFVGNVIMNVK